ncbi:MAG: hypothetical protein ACW976_03055 [Candidatus Ranarchaeia archaeon]
MDSQARLHLWVLIIAFGMVFVWGALIPTLFGISSFSAQTVDVGLSNTGAPPLAAMDSSFSMVFVVGAVLTLVFIGLVYRLAQQSPSARA